LISNDRGDTSLPDFQYFCFNLILLAYFVYTFFANPELGLPSLPVTLVGLTSASAAGYAASKYSESTPAPTINSVNPQRIMLGHDPVLDIAGANFGEENPLNMPLLCQVKLNGRPLTYNLTRDESGYDPTRDSQRRIVSWHAEWIRVYLPGNSEIPDRTAAQGKGFIPSLSADGSVAESSVELVVSDRYGRSPPPHRVVVTASP
jgi:hypothetical protein